jgi:hypothetical protein
MFPGARRFRDAGIQITATWLWSERHEFASRLARHRDLVQARAHDLCRDDLAKGTSRQVDLTDGESALVDVTGPTLLVAPLAV